MKQIIALLLLITFFAVPGKSMARDNFLVSVERGHIKIVKFQAKDGILLIRPSVFADRMPVKFNNEHEIIYAFHPKYNLLAELEDDNHWVWAKLKLYVLNDTPDAMEIKKFLTFAMQNAGDIDEYINLMAKHYKAQGASRLGGKKKGEMSLEEYEKMQTEQPTRGSDTDGLDASEAQFCRSMSDKILNEKFCGQYQAPPAELLAKMPPEMAQKLKTPGIGQGEVCLNQHANKLLKNGAVPGDTSPIGGIWRDLGGNTYAGQEGIEQSKQDAALLKKLSAVLPFDIMVSRGTNQIDGNTLISYRLQLKQAPFFGTQVGTFLDSFAKLN